MEIKNLIYMENLSQGVKQITGQISASSNSTSSSYAGEVGLARAAVGVNALGIGARDAIAITEITLFVQSNPGSAVSSASARSAVVATNM